VARLKGSDPVIFGRGGEEAKFLKRNNIRFEIIPGITSGIAAPVYAGIPCTDREKASFCLFVTGHKASDKIKSSVPWDWVAGAKDGTTIIYMGVREIENIVRKLIDSGMPPDLPAAVVERGTFPSQRIFVSTLEQLPQKVSSEGIRPPAIFILGEVVNLQPFLDWFDNLPLHGIRIMVTRPADQAKDLYQLLRDLGAEPMPYPTISTEANDDAQGWQSFKQTLSGQGWIVFTSENGVRYFFDQLGTNIGDIRSIADFKIATIGKSTAQVLEEYNLKSDFVPKKSTAAHLAKEMKQAFDLNDETIIRVRGNLAGDAIEKTLPDEGATVIPLTVYRTYHPIWPDGLKDKLFDNPPHAILFTSASTINGLYENLSGEEVGRLVADAKIFSLGPMVTKRLESYNLPLTRMAETHTIQGLLDTVVDYYKTIK
jgi:uroporphyrinogen III methyltransferase/synthase